MTEDYVLDRAEVRRAFNRAAASYDAHAVLQCEVCDRLLERLGFMKLTPQQVLDVGAGRGAAKKVSRSDSSSTFCAAPLPAPQALSAGLEILLHTDVRRDVTTLTQPTLVIHGSLDKLTPPSAGAWLAEAIPRAKYCLIDGAAHAPFLSHPQQVAEAILESVHD